MKVILNENQFNRVILKEYHHAYGNGLEQDAENIAQIAIGIYNDYIRNPFNADTFSQIKNYGQRPYHVQSLDVNLKVKLVGGSVSGCDRWGEYIAVSYDSVEDAVKNNHMQRLVSVIYHELGHLTNGVKSDYARSEADRDFKTPLFLDMNDEDYKQIQTILYRFYSRELKARCFETTMFLKKNTNPNITIQDVYNDRCSDITMMRGFIKMLQIGAQEGPQSQYGSILDGLSKYTWEENAGWNRYNRRNKNRKVVDKIKWKYKCRNTINYFMQKYRWLKKRIDKIFYDYKSGNL